MVQIPHCVAFLTVTETVYRLKHVVCVKTTATVVWLDVATHLQLIAVVDCCWSDVAVCLPESRHDAVETVDVYEVMQTSCVVKPVSVWLLKHQAFSERVSLATWTPHHSDVDVVLEETVNCQTMSS